MPYPTYRSIEAEALPSGTYLGLFHGRTDPKQDMPDWGFDGPVIGPINFAQTTYNGMIRVALLGERDFSITIPIVESCAEFEGKFYGDWTMFQHTQRRTGNTPVTTERRKG